MLAWEPTEAEEEKASDFSPLLYILPPRRTKAASFLSSAFRNKGLITPIPSAFFLEAQLTNECLKAQVAFLCTH